MNQDRAQTAALGALPPRGSTLRLEPWDVDRLRFGDAILIPDQYNGPEKGAWEIRAVDRNHLMLTWRPDPGEAEKHR